MAPPDPNGRSKTRESANTSPRPGGGSGRIGAIALLLLTAATILVSAGGAGATPIAGAAHPSVAPLAVSAAPTSSWAWGVAANLSAQVQLVGEYNASQAIGANATRGLAYGSLDLAFAEQYVAYEIVNLTPTSNTTLYLTAEAVDYRAAQLAVDLSGTFPAAGTYNATTPIPQVAVNGSARLDVAVLDAYAAFLNLTTGPNGSVALANEHVVALRAFNLSATLVDFPNATVNSAGDEVIAYTTASVAAAGAIVTNVTATFSPPLVLAPGPLNVGTNWTTNSTAAFVGTTSEAVRYAFAVPGKGSASWSAAATTSANATVSVSLACSVVADEPMRNPDGTVSPDPVVDCVSTGGAAPVSNGLAMLPVSALGGSASGDHAPMSASPAAASLAVPSREIVSPTQHVPVGEQTDANGGSTVTSEGLAPSAAQVSIAELRSPTMPSVPLGATGSGGVVVLAFLVASIAGCVAIGREAIRGRR